MTWIDGVPFRAVVNVPRAVLAAAALLALAGCSSDSKSASLVLESPADDALLTLADDTDADRAGLQVSVSGSSSGVKAATMLEVLVDDVATGDEGEIGAGGDFTIEGVTLPPGTHDIVVRTLTGSVSSGADHSYTFKGLVIASPTDGTTLQLEDDEDLDRAGIQISVTVDSFAIELTEDITLELDGTEVGTETPDADGQAVFQGITLISGSHRLLATSGEGDAHVESDEVTVNVRESCAAVTFTQPAVPAGVTSLMLGGGSECPTGNEPYTTTVAISTDAGNGRPTQLFVNGQPVASGTVQGAAVVFNDVALSRLETANTISVEVENSEGVTCREDLNVDIFVDCAGPDCVLASPVPVSYTDDGGDTTLFLNSSYVGANGFEFTVETSSEAVGHEVSLIVDGDLRDAFTADAEAAGSAGEAVFGGVALADGSHKVEARCTDAAGNESFSGELTWVVDTAACLVDVTDPVADAMLVPADDTNNATAGTQIVVSSSVGGSDCIAQRAATCDPADGISGMDFVPYDGTTPLLATVDLDDSGGDQTLCVEVQDRAGNVGSASVDVSFLADAPMLQFESPADGSEYNVLGNGGANRVMDADDLAADCQADFAIACTELGTQVELRHDSATGTVFAMADCEAPGAGGPALPSGYAGRATVRARFSDGDQSAVIVATQTLSGSSGQLLVGESSALNISGDCSAPAPTFFGNPCNAPDNFLQVASPTDNYLGNVRVLAGAPDSPTLSLNVDHSVDGARDVTPDASTQGMFSAVDYGGVGTVTLTGTATDAFGNVGTIACTATIVEDVPTISMSAPTDQASFGPRAVLGDTCDTGDPAEYGVPVTATVDRRTGRTASISVAGAPTTVDLTASDIVTACPDPDMPCTFTRCVAVDDDLLTGGGSAIVARADSVTTSAFATATATVHVTTFGFLDPTDGVVLGAGASDCAPGGGFDQQVQLQVDPMYLGQSWQVSDGTNMISGTAGGTTVSDCLALSQGPATLTATVGAGGAMRSIDLTVATFNPSNEIAITATCPDMGSTSYRDDPVHVDWANVSTLEDWPGQFQDYVFKCSGATVADAATPEDWWTDAYEVALPPSVTPDSGTSEADLSARFGERRHCALRASDAGGLLTPITASEDLTCAFREALMYDAPVDFGGFGISAAAVGDVNNDDIDDVLVGGAGRAHLFFGTASGIPTAPDVTFIGASDFGGKVAGLGDFNGDGENDFAISYSRWTGTQGQVFILYGRTQDDWPATIDLSTGCNADLCIKHSVAGARLGTAVRNAGDFNADGFYDLFVGAEEYASGVGQAFVVLGDNYETRSCGGPADCRANEVCGATSVCELDTDLFWGLDFELPSANWLNPPSGGPTLGLKAFQMDGVSGTHAKFGGNAAALGDLDQATGTRAGDDLVIAALGTGSPGVSQLYFLSGRSYTAGVGLQTLSVPGAFGFRGGGGTPSGTPFETQTASFGIVMTSPGNVYDAPSFSGDVVDLVVKEGDVGQYFYVYPGEANFDPAQRLRVQAPNASRTEIGITIGTGFNPGLPPHSSFPAASQDLLGDLDGDGLVDLCVGSLRALRPGSTCPEAPYCSPGGVLLWHADALAMNVDTSSAGPTRAGTVDHLTGSRIEPATSADTQTRTVQYIGDINDDGHPDILVTDWHADGYQGRGSVLY